jgi:hypothetical protein
MKYVMGRGRKRLLRLDVRIGNGSRKEWGDV